MMWFITFWLIGAAASWIGVVIYVKNLTAWTWNGFFEVAKATMKSPIIEMLKWFLFVIAWPVEIAAVVYQVIYQKLLTRRLVNNLEKLGL